MLSEYDINRVGRVHSMIELGDKIFPIIEEMWEECVEAKKKYDAYGKTKREGSDDILGVWAELILEGSVLHKFFSRIYDAFQEVGREREEANAQMVKEHEEMLERIKQWGEDGTFKETMEMFEKMNNK